MTMTNNISNDILDSLKVNFTKCVKGYHLINDDPIKESPWEDINAIVLNASGCAVNSQSDGSHKPGADLYCLLGTPIKGIRYSIINDKK